MFRPRLMPVLLVKDGVLVKSVKFRDHRYIGDPVNAVRLFNDLKADELVFLDISASAQGKAISSRFLKEVAEEAHMPFGAGGGFSKVAQIKTAMAAGAEKVIIGTAAALRPEFVREAADQFGASSISVCIDVRKNIWGKEVVWVQNGKKAIAQTPVEMAMLMQEMGAGELIIQSITHDGMMQGYHLELIRKVAQATTIPVVALGGAGNDLHLREGYLCGATAVAAGSRFVYQGTRKGVLINYPENTKLIFS